MGGLGELKLKKLSQVERRLFLEYGAVFTTRATPPSVIIFADANEVGTFQSSLDIGHAVFGDHDIELQAKAIEALCGAASEAGERGKRITARAADAGRRSYEDTVRLWTRNVSRGLDHWTELARIAPDRAQSIRQLTPVEQVSRILDLEDSERVFFGTFFDKSILHSVAAPGASQHLSLLAFDVAEYQDEQIAQILGNHGWHRTVPNDLPHFTYLGYEERALPGLGLIRSERAYEKSVYEFWTPDIEAVICK